MSRLTWRLPMGLAGGVIAFVGGVLCQANHNSLLCALIAGVLIGVATSDEWTRRD